MFDVTLLYNKSNPYGISKDVECITKAIGGTGCTIRRSDPLEPPVLTDLAIHLEIPIFAWVPWAARNILVVNPEWFEAAWVPYLERFDLVVYKDAVAARKAVEAAHVTQEKVRVIPWGCFEPVAPAVPAGSKGKKIPQGTADTGFVWFLGASKNKQAAVAPIVGAWKEEYPPLRIYSAVDLSGVLGAGASAIPANVRFETRDLDSDTRDRLARFFRGHICCSAAEGFGYTAAEAEWYGAFTLLNALPVYEQDYGSSSSGVALLPSLDSAELAAPLAAAIAAFEAADFDAIAQSRRASAAARWASFQAGVGRIVEEVRASGIKRLKRLPPPLEPADCPPISVVTLLHNRRKFFDLACHSLMIQDYPKDKIEWIIVEDSDDPMEDASDRVMAVAAAAAPVRVEYIPLKKKTPIGKKRNLGVAKATAHIILMMDDDDHYPETSFRRRVAWLTRSPWENSATGVDCAACTTIACYDLNRAISAVNVPPLTLPFEQRVSEATLTFRKSFWQERGGFPDDVQIGEGEGFLGGQVGRVLEIPPQQIIVAFSHGKNASSRRVPSDADVKPGCFWGFPPEFLQFIHRLAGVEIVDEKAGGKTKR
jgi:hypothetical protein